MLSIENKFKMEEILAKLNNLEAGNSRIETKIDRMQMEIDDLRKENKMINKENKELKRIVEKQEQRMNSIELEMKRKNLVISGVHEDEEEESEEMHTKVKDLLKQIRIEEKYYKIIGRIGRKLNGKTRPVSIEAQNVDEKMKILHMAKKLAGSKIYIDEDFPRNIREERKQLIPYIKQARNEGHRTFLQINKIKINNRLMSLEEIQKRNGIDCQASSGLNVKKGRTISERSPNGNSGTNLKKFFEDVSTPK